MKNYAKKMPSTRDNTEIYIKQESRSSKSRSRNSSSSSDDCNTRSIGGSFISRPTSPANLHSDSEHEATHKDHRKQNKSRNPIKQEVRSSRSRSPCVDLTRSTAVNNRKNNKGTPRSSKNILDQGRYRNEKTLEVYLSNKPNLEIADPKGNRTATLSTEDLDENEEIWFVQCPRNVSIEKLVGQKIKLNGKTNVLNIGADQQQFEYNTEQINDPKYSTIINKSHDGRAPHCAISFLPSGLIRIRNEPPTLPAKEIVQVTDMKVPYPKNLKVRHPLLGFDFVGRSELSESVQNQLKQAKHRLNLLKSETFIKKEKRIKIEDRRSSEDIDESLTNNANLELTPKRKKRLISECSTTPATPTKKLKKARRIKVEEEKSNLDWLSQI